VSTEHGFGGKLKAQRVFSRKISVPSDRSHVQGVAKERRSPENNLIIFQGATDPRATTTARQKIGTPNRLAVEQKRDVGVGQLSISNTPTMAEDKNSSKIAQRPSPQLLSSRNSVAKCDMEAREMV